MKTLRVISAAAAGGMLSFGCALTPPATQNALEQARQAYNEAQADANVARLAPAELTQAGATLNRAELLARQGSDSEEVGHAAYIARQETQVARHRAMARAAEQELAQADSTRQRVMLEARAREAEAARERAEQERQAALAKAGEAERGRLQALEAREEGRRKIAADVQRLRGEMAKLKARETDRGWVLGLGSEMLFDTGKSTLKPGARRSLERVAAFMREHSGYDIAVEGFTDSTGGDAINQKLSDERAQAVRQVLVETGVPANRISARGHGEAFPVASNDSPAGRQLNRRVEIVIAEPAGQSAVGR